MWLCFPLLAKGHTVGSRSTRRLIVLSVSIRCKRCRPGVCFRGKKRWCRCCLQIIEVRTKLLGKNVQVQHLTTSTSSTSSRFGCSSPLVVRLTAAPWWPPWPSLQLEGAAVQLPLDSLKVRPILRPSAPAFEHDLVQKVRTFGRSRHPVALDDPFIGLLVGHG